MTTQNKFKVGDWVQIISYDGRVLQPIARIGATDNPVYDDIPYDVYYMTEGCLDSEYCRDEKLVLLPKENTMIYELAYPELAAYNG